MVKTAIIIILTVREIFYGTQIPSPKWSSLLKSVPSTGLYCTTIFIVFKEFLTVGKYPTYLQSGSC